MEAFLYLLTPVAIVPPHQGKAFGFSFLPLTRVKCPVTFDHPLFLLEHLCDEHLLWYLFPRSSGDTKQYDFALLFASPACLRLIEKKSLGNKNRQHPGPLSAKWNPESGSQTSHHTFCIIYSFFTLLCCQKGLREVRTNRSKYVCWETGVWKHSRAQVQSKT